MFEAEIDNSVILKQKEVLERCLTTNPKTKEALQELVRQALKDVRPEVVSAARAALASDPRGAAHGIRTAVYKKILGGNLNILNMRRKAGHPTSYEPPRKLNANPRQRGGNRVPRGARTQQVMSYGPHDRGWILRIVNSGTGNRTAGTRSGRLHGNRGAIAARNFFAPAARQALGNAATILSGLIDNELEKILNGNQ